VSSIITHKRIGDAEIQTELRFDSDEAMLFWLIMQTVEEDEEE